MTPTQSSASKGASKDEPAPKRKSSSKGISAQDVAIVLRQRIQDNEITADEWLRESRICSEFNVGRSIARRALRELEDDGLVELEENRGARVSSTTAEEVFDLYEIRSALYGLAARFACMRAPDDVVQIILADIDEMLALADANAISEDIMEISERLFSTMTQYTSADAQKMIAAIRQKTRFHFSYVALALTTHLEGPYDYWRDVRQAFVDRDIEAAANGARNILYFMQAEVSQIMLTQGARTRTSNKSKS